MGTTYYRLIPYLLVSLTAAYQGCSTGIETATSNGTSSGQAISGANSTSISKEPTASASDSQASVTGGDRKSSNSGAQSTTGNGGSNIATTPSNVSGKATTGDKSTTVIGGSNIATAPGNIAGSLHGDLPGGGVGSTGALGDLASPPGNVGGMRDRVSADGSYSGTATAGSEMGVSAITDLTAQNGLMAADPTPIAVSSGPTSIDRWTDTGDASKLGLHCTGTASFGGNVWQGDCTVVTPSGIELDLLSETTTRNWNVTAAVGCNPQQSEEASYGAVTHTRLLYVGPVIATCVPTTVVKLQATSHRGQSFTLVKTLTR